MTTWHFPGVWQARTMERLLALGCTGFTFGPGVKWFPIKGAKRVAGPFTTTKEFDAWLDAREQELT